MIVNGLRMTSVLALLIGLFLFGGVPGKVAHAFTYDYKTAQKVWRSSGYYSYKNQHGYKKHHKSKRYGHKKQYGHAQQHGYKNHKHKGHKHRRYGNNTRIIIVPGHGHHAQKPYKSYNHATPKPVYKQHSPGVIVHGHVGKTVAKHLTPYDSVQVNQSLETVKTGHSRSWFNDKTGKILTVSLLRTYRNEYSDDCRDYRFQVKRDNHDRSIEGSACRLNNGSWKLVS